MSRWSLLVPLILGFAGATAQAGPDHDGAGSTFDEAAFDRFVEGTRRSYDVSGAVVVVADANGTVFAKGYGVRERGKPGSVDPDTRFQIASVSKFVAATAVGTIIDRGLVSWDEPVQAFSPETVLAVPYATATATLRDYFSHRTGMPAYTGDLLADLGLPPQELVRRARHLPFDHTFRSKMAYSNYGIFLAQQAVATAARMTAGELLVTGIFDPLGMNRSGPGLTELFKDENRAAGHDRDGTVMAYENVDAFSGAGAIVSTGTDVARWMRMLLAGGRTGDRQILSSTTIDQIFAASMVEGPAGPLHDQNAVAALGCDSYQFLGRRIVEKNGALNGFRTIVTLIPDLRIGIAVFANKQLTVFPEAVRAEFLERHIGRTGFDLQARVHAEQPAWNALLDVPKTPVDASPIGRDPGAYAGTFDNPLYGVARVVRRPDGPGITISDRPATLTHWSADTFLLTFPNPDMAPGLLTFHFEADAAIRIEGSRLPTGLSVNYGVFESRR